MNQIWEFLQAVVNIQEVQILAYLILANLATGLAVSIKTWTFELVRFKDFARRALSVFVAYVGVAIAANLVADFDELLTIVWVALLAYLTAKIVKNLAELGLPIPERITRMFDSTTNWEYEDPEEEEESEAGA